MGQGTTGVDEKYAAAWLVHATMLSRGVQAIATEDATQAPELFWVSDLRPDTDYPFLEIRTEGMTANGFEEFLVRTGQMVQTGPQRGLPLLTDTATLIFPRTGGVAR